MDFALLPPEINSGRMYSGPGAGPMLAAASSWDALAAEMRTAATTYETVIAELANGWSGPSATTMAAAATPYAQWLHTTATQAEHTASQAKAAAAAYQTAFTMTVPPPVIAANRGQLATLLATNFFGQNTTAIAATEAHYAQMWAQDATAMHTYAANAAAATRLTPLTQPPQTTNPTASGALLAAALAPAAAAELSIAGLELFTDAVGTFGIDVLGTFLIDALGAVEYGVELAPFAGLAGWAAPATAGMGQATLVSGLSVPRAWAITASAAARPTGAALSAAGGQSTSVTAAEAAIPFVAITAAGLAGRAAAGAGRATAGQVRRGRAPSQGRQRPPMQHTPLPAQAYGLVTEIELRELAELRHAKILTDDEYSQQKRQLLGR